jgi:hypothetical protein
MRKFWQKWLWFPMELEDSKRESARLTWLIEEALEGRHHLARAGVDQHSVRAYVDHHMAPANADAERARWCEDRKAQVYWDGHIKKWAVYYESGMVTHVHRDSDRNIAIDQARGVAK